jgi:RNA polymerase sigma-70 factor, ECF subfamily
MGSICNSTFISTAFREALTVPPDDVELLRRIGRGDEAAFRLLVDRHARYLYGIAASMLGDTADAEDVVQETFAAVLSANFRGESSVRTWLVQILVRQAALARRKRRRPMASLDAGSTAAAETEARSSEIAGAEAKLDLATMLKTLSPEHRQVIVLREVEQMSYDEIAETLSVPRGTVESRLHRARAELRERFKGYL